MAAHTETTPDHRTLYQFGYRRSPDQDAAEPTRYPVVIVGAGPVGLAAAIDLTLRGVKVVLLDDADRIGEGSRGICYAKRTLEVLGRLGVAQPCLDKGVVWKVGKVFFKEAQVWQFDLLPEDGHAMPAFINLQQYYLEHFLVERAIALGVDLRWRNKVVGIEQGNDGATVRVMTPEGEYRLSGAWLIAADGPRSTLRGLLGLEWRGEIFEDRFLIADVKMSGDFPPERWFWFEPPFHGGHSALLHKQPDDVWRIDLQLGPEADPAEEQRPEKVVPRLKQMLGHDRFELEWVSLYSFQCRRIDRFVHGRVVFAGDSAHQVSPFGARGANSGIQDAENLAWKLATVLNGEAPEALIETYHAERSQAADENIRHSTRSTDFIAPRSPQEVRFRDATLALARSAPFAQRMINSGRLSIATVHDTSLSTPDADRWNGTAQLGAPAPDAPVEDAQGKPIWFLDLLGSAETLVAFGAVQQVECRLLLEGRDFHDRRGLLRRRLDASDGAAFLFRPDQHLTARWRQPEATDIAAARRRLRGH